MVDLTMSLKSHALVLNQGLRLTRNPKGRYPKWVRSGEGIWLTEH
jgi:hypothetical protein